MTSIPAEYPAEEIHEGVALQRVNAINPRTQEFSHQIVYLGTEAQARALAELPFWEHTSARWQALRAIVGGR
jgi:hypothetical protein